MTKETIIFLFLLAFLLTIYFVMQKPFDFSKSFFLVSYHLSKINFSFTKILALVATRKFNCLKKFFYRFCFFKNNFEDVRNFFYCDQKIISPELN